MEDPAEPEPGIGGGPDDSPNEQQGVPPPLRPDAWAVGYYFNGMSNQTLVEHWNGKAWKVQPSLNPGGSTPPTLRHQLNQLYGVAATSPTNAWAVGDYYNGTSNQTLIEHWNGTGLDGAAEP